MGWYPGLKCKFESMPVVDVDDDAWDWEDEYEPLPVYKCVCQCGWESPTDIDQTFLIELFKLHVQGLA